MEPVLRHTAGPWVWHFDSRGASLRTPDRGCLVVMDPCRKGMNGASVRFAYWPGVDDGEDRGRRGGILEGFNPKHPDAVLIASAPTLAEENAKLRAALVRAGELALAGLCQFSLGGKHEFLKDIKKLADGGLG